MNVLTRKPMYLWINDSQPGHDQPRLQIFGTKNQLTADLIDTLDECKRVFVTSNSKGLIKTLCAIIRARYGTRRRILEVTSETIDQDAVTCFIEDVKARTPEYDAILASPSIGTGVDISFPGKEKLVDCVYGFFEAGITAHMECDQQLGRVRDPKEIKVWISPRRSNLETNFDVVKRDLLEQNLFQGLLRDFDTHDEPIYDEANDFLHMAAMAISEERASKNNLKKHFIEHKKRQGYLIEIVTDCGEGKVAGRELLKIGKALTEAEYRDRKTSSTTLTKTAFTLIYETLSDGDSVTDDERWAYQRTRLELFYRTPASLALIEMDDRGRHRDRVLLYEAFTRQWPDGTMKPTLDANSRILKSPQQRLVLMSLLLEATPIFRDGRFDPSVAISNGDLTEFIRVTRERKAEVETLLGLEVRSDVGDKAVQQLNAVLKKIGLKVDGYKKEKKSSQKTYSYQIKQENLDRLDDICRTRNRVGGWQSVYESYGWDMSDLDDEVGEWIV